MSEGWSRLKRSCFWRIEVREPDETGTPRWRSYCTVGTRNELVPKLRELHRTRGLDGVRARPEWAAVLKHERMAKAAREKAAMTTKVVASDYVRMEESWPLEWPRDLTLREGQVLQALAALIDAPDPTMTTGIISALIAEDVTDLLDEGVMDEVTAVCRGLCARGLVAEPAPHTFRLTLPTGVDLARALVHRANTEE